MFLKGVNSGRYGNVTPSFFKYCVSSERRYKMLESDKYAYVNIGGGVESVYIRIKKNTPMPETDKAKLIAWAQEKGFIVSNRKRILHAE